jgi:hypothetical protein
VSGTFLFLDGINSYFYDDYETSTNNQILSLDLATFVVDIAPGITFTLRGKKVFDPNATASKVSSVIEREFVGSTFFGRTITPHIDDLSPRVVASFHNREVTPAVLTTETVFYRVWGEGSGRVSSYITRNRPDSRLKAIIDLALAPEFNNSAIWISEVRVPAGVPIYEGLVASVGSLRGQGNQVYVPFEWLVDEWFGLPTALR